MQDAPQTQFASTARWNWSPRAGHHKAVCAVETSQGNGVKACGCGVLIEHEGLRGVLTCRHGLAGRTTEVIFFDGTKRSGEWTKDKFGHDLAFVRVDHPGIVALKLAEEMPVVGDRVEIASYTVLPRQMRHFYATLTRIDQYKIEHDAYILQGDSGGPILNSRNEVIGLNTFGTSPAGQIGSSYLYRNGGGPPHQPTCRFLRRCRARYRPRAVRPGSVLMPVAPSQPIVGIPEPPGSVPAPLPDIPPVVEHPRPPVNCDPCAGVKVRLASLELRVEDLEKQPPCEPGESGPPGPPGPPGESCDVDECVDRVIAILEDKLPNGDTNPITHYVLVAEESADYWPRVGRYYQDAKEVFWQIRLTDPPATPVGTMPQLVAYAFGSPIGSFVGQRDVESALVDIERGHKPIP